MSITPDTKDWTWVLQRACPECGFDAASHPVEELPGLVHDAAMTWSDVLRRAGVAGWDQDETSVAERYGEQEPAVVAVDLIEAAGTVAGLYAGIAGATRHRRGLRSAGAEFTVETLGQYHLHDVVHHLHDVGADPRSATIRAYDADASRYARHTSTMVASVRADIEELGPHLRSTGVEADLVDPLTADLASPDRPYDAVWAKEGDGEACSTHGSISAARHFTFWRADAVRPLVEGAGWAEVEVTTGLAGRRSDTWLEVKAVRA